MLRRVSTGILDFCRKDYGEDETGLDHPRGNQGAAAAGVIHDDFERGFIKAEVIGFDEFIACGGSYAACKAAGKLRIEGKEYIVRDGDIINFRFNV